MKIQQIRNIFPNLQVARFNLAAWQKLNSDSVYLIGREVVKASALGQPDTGILKLFELSSEGSIVQERTIWEPMFEGINLEDPRALELENENLVIGLTAVLCDKSGRSLPFPAIVKINSVNTWEKELPPFLVISTFGSGKNMTPVDNFTFLFRPDSPDYNHKILAFSVHAQTPEKLGDIEFPTSLPWAQWRIGTTMPPIWLNPTEALFIIHGITIQKIDGQDKYVYSIGRAKLTRLNNIFSLTVAPDPILTPDNFIDQNGLPLVQELHPDIRRVVYSCGGIIKRHKRDSLSLYVNVGDRTTFEVDLSLEELKEGLF
ncbi:MAG: hypothetical protein WCT01_00215 [Candidatus Shapirobacteria bacterium]|jgi:predicted GH43/DUF377 family glycosyl hydrolase